MQTENKTQEYVLIDALEKTNSGEITVGNTTISEVDNSKVCVDIDGVDENKVEDVNVFQIQTDIDTNGNDEIDECLTSYIVDMKVEDSDDAMLKTVSKGSSSKTMTSDGRIKIKSSIWYNTVNVSAMRVR